MLQLLSALVMIGLVLIQHGKGADMGASFGSGASGSLFGATGSANFLSRSTAVLRRGVLRLHPVAGLFLERPRASRRRRQRARPAGAAGIRGRFRAPAASTPAAGAAQIPGTAAPASAGLPAAAPTAPPASGAAAIPVR